MFECCRIVTGCTKSVIYDLQRSKNRYIPNDLANILLNHNRNKIKEVLASISSEFHNILLENISLLIDEEYVFLTETPERFPAMSLEWDEPSQISNAIIENGEWLKDKKTYQKLSELNILGCKHIEIRIYNKISISEMFSILALIQKVEFLSIDVIAHYPLDFHLESVSEFILKNYNLHNFIIFNSPISKKISGEDSDFGTVVLTTNSLESRIHCGAIHLKNFNDNIKFFTESLHHNSCLNRKISIDAEGNIKNCPSMKESFGNIRDTTLSEAIEKPGFKNYWDTNKDKIHVCKDCEFRYICTDCRAYVEDPEDILSKPLKCGYNPYTGEWSEWSTNPLKQKAIDFYGMREMVDEMKN